MAPEDFACLSEKDGETLLYAYIQPKAQKSEISGVFRERLKIRVCAPPAEGEANRECIDFLSGALGVSKSEIRLQKGGRSREKTFVISRPMDYVREKLEEGLHGNKHPGSGGRRPDGKRNRAGGRNERPSGDNN